MSCRTFYSIKDTVRRGMLYVVGDLLTLYPKLVISAIGNIGGVASPVVCEGKESGFAT